MRVFLNEISIWNGKLSKADCHLQDVWASDNPLGAWLTQKSQGKENFVSNLTGWAGICISSPRTEADTYSTSGSWAFGPRRELHRQLPWVPAGGSQIMGRHSLRNPASQFSIINLFMSVPCWLCFSEGLLLTYYLKPNGKNFTKYQKLFTANGLTCVLIV